MQRIEGVAHVQNEIEVLPLSPNDDRIPLQRYGYQAVPPIHIIVKNGKITLGAVVANEGGKNIANIAANGVSGV